MRPIELGPIINIKKVLKLFMELGKLFDIIPGSMIFIDLDSVFKTKLWWIKVSLKKYLVKHKININLTK